MASVVKNAQYVRAWACWVDEVLRQALSAVL